MRAENEGNDVERIGGDADIVNMVRCFFFVIMCFAAVCAVPALSPAGDNGYAVWESPSRFYEFSDDGTFRIVLKPYYSYVYQPELSLSWSAELMSDSLKSDVSDNTELHRTFLVSVQYPGKNGAAAVPLCITDSGLYLNFFVCTRPEQETVQPVTIQPDLITKPLLRNGFWQHVGSRDCIRLYNEPPIDETFCWYFHDNLFWLIRYWKTDNEYREAPAVVFTSDQSYSIPRFLKKDGAVYSCVTINEKAVSHVMFGTYCVDSVRGGMVLSVQDNGRPKRLAAVDCPALRGAAEITDSPDAFNGTRIFVPMECNSSRCLFVSGRPDAVMRRMDGVDSNKNPLDDLIAAHNSKRRPLRKPLFAYMDLDFHWEEITVLSGRERDDIRQYLSQFSVPWLNDEWPVISVARQGL